MGFLRKSKPNRPTEGSYQERFRAIGHQLDRDQMRFRLLIEIPDGFVLKAEEPYNSQQGDTGNAWATRTFWLDDADIKAMAERAYDDRKHNRTSSNTSRDVS